VIENLNLQPIKREDAISLLTDALPVKFPFIMIISATGTEVKVIIHSLKLKIISDYNEISTNFEDLFSFNTLSITPSL
jgi:hypothetical protein